MLILVSIILVVGCTPAATQNEGQIEEDLIEEKPETGEEPESEEEVVDDGTPAQLVVVTLSEWDITLDKKTVNVGKVKFIITNDGPKYPHSFRITNEEKSLDHRRGVNLDEVETLQVNLEAGTYEISCPSSGHKEKGMDAILIVQ